MLSPGNKNPRCAGVLEPSPGLEPGTASLPWRFRGGTGGHGRARAVTFFLQIEPSRRVDRARACPRVLNLMYPSRTRGSLSVSKTSNIERGIRAVAQPHTPSGTLPDSGRGEHLRMLV